MKNVNLYPLEVNYCDKCHNCQLSVSVRSKKNVFKLFIYLINFKSISRNHFINAAKKYTKELKLNKKKSL